MSNDIAKCNGLLWVDNDGDGYAYCDCRYDCSLYVTHPGDRQVWVKPDAIGSECNMFTPAYSLEEGAITAGPCKRKGCSGYIAARIGARCSKCNLGHPKEGETES